MTTTAVGVTVAELAEVVGREHAGPFADEVDLRARFPVEAVAALKRAGLLGAAVPRDLGGAGATTSELANATRALATYCSSTAMIFAMHQLQVACLARHGRTGAVRAFLREVAEEQLLVASATSEVGVGGDVRRSICAVGTDSATGDLTVEKNASVVSYGQYADAVLASARRTPESPPSDQVLVLCRPPGLELEPSSSWDTLGFRGTCSPGFRLAARVKPSDVLDDPFSDIVERTMLPVSHILWSAVWLGIATAAMDRGRRYVRAEARKDPTVTPPAATRLAELSGVFQTMTELVNGAARRYDERCESDEVATMSFAVAMNNLKVAASTMVVDVVGRAMVVCGIAGYREDSPYRLGRLLRDAHGAALMVNNDRLIANNAQMLLVSKDEYGR